MEKILQYFINSDGILWHTVYAFLQIAIAYFVACVFLPSLLLYKKLKDRPIIFRVMAYQVVANIYINLVGFLLVYLKIFSIYMCIIFILLVPIGIRLYMDRALLKGRILTATSVVGDVLVGVYGFKIIRGNIIKFIKKIAFYLYKKLFEGRVIEWTFIILTIIYLIMFLGYPRFFHASYGHTDEETHIFWINSIYNNNAFSTGLYPYGMHFVASMLTATFGIHPDYGSLSFSLVSSSMIFVSLYMVARTIFKSKYVALFTWVIVLITGIFHHVSYFRFSYIFPMEFSLFPVVVALYALIMTVKNKDRLSFLLFSGALAWSVFGHFYGTIFFAFICMIFGVLFLRFIIKNKLLLKYILYGVLGLSIAAAPFAVGLVMGYEFERSIAWAIGVMTNNEDLQNTGLNEEDETEPTEATEAPTEDDEEDIPLTLESLAYQLTTFVYSNFDSLGIAVSLFLACLLYSIIGLIVMKKRRMEFLIYLFICGIWAFMIVLALADVIGLPPIIQRNRVAVFIFMISTVLYGIAGQLFYDLISIVTKKEKVLNNIVIGAGVVGILTTFLTNSEKEELMYTKLATDADSKLVQDLIYDKDHDPWTVVTTTNMLSIIRNDGFHVEIMDLLFAADYYRDFYIPTETFYLVTEKMSNGYDEAVLDITGDHYYNSATPISKYEALRTDINIHNAYGAQKDRAYYFSRPMVMSKLYYLVEEIKLAYPDHISVYYEDRFSVDYMATLREEQEAEQNATTP